MRHIDVNTVLLETDEESERAQELVRQQPPRESENFHRGNAVVRQLEKEFGQGVTHEKVIPMRA